MIRVRLPEADPVVTAGVESWLTSHPDISIATDSPADVFVAVEGLVDGFFFESLGETARRIGAVVVLALDNMPDEALDAAVRAGVVTVLPRKTMDRDRLVNAVITASLELTGDEELWEALDEMRATGHHVPVADLDAWDVQLLNLVADGWDSHEIAKKVSLSPRTVINRVQAVVQKCGARNRFEVVAQAVRAGLV
ncbi:DNA-binding response regulator, NarL/FixJ family, contains REC and HTH domains [Lentzea waywayandensis]|uniref:DNA-binding response regulator, NarL/FixJ family, contains REC and HTH domains n=1 Tax=Lentzea waywayandensis TaxID=84724 RepID=A0A1I6FJ11_9PSEU|nr:LuxR C-terminal-related transcriptional regulator [Lentzea waywayandensis]SFR29929.1 DNA-binding response regulator, NarL/FixJ family, contains REC and HTH domains [Lentzea waywayandensis]